MNKLSLYLSLLLISFSFYTTANAQPYNVILDPATEQNTIEPMGYNLDVDTFIEFLEKGIEGYKNR